MAAVADAIDSRVTLHHERIVGTKVAPTQAIECCGFTASVVTP